MNFLVLQYILAICKRNYDRSQTKFPGRGGGFISEL